jgi:hypothetical protein
MVTEFEIKYNKLKAHYDSLVKAVDGMQERINKTETENAVLKAQLENADQRFLN